MSLVFCVYRNDKEKEYRMLSRIWWYSTTCNSPNTFYPNNFRYWFLVFHQMKWKWNMKRELAKKHERKNVRKMHMKERMLSTQPWRYKTHHKTKQRLKSTKLISQYCWSTLFTIDYIINKMGALLVRVLFASLIPLPLIWNGFNGISNLTLYCLMSAKFITSRKDI